MHATPRWRPIPTRSPRSCRTRGHGGCHCSECNNAKCTSSRPEARKVQLCGVGRSRAMHRARNAGSSVTDGHRMHLQVAQRARKAKREWLCCITPPATLAELWALSCPRQSCDRKRLMTCSRYRTVRPPCAQPTPHPCAHPCLLLAAPHSLTPRDPAAVQAVSAH